MTVYLDALLAALSLPALLASSYLLLLTLLSASLTPPRASGPSPKFLFIVPAHNEEAGIAATVRSLQAVDYPSAAFDVLVVADNCTDATAACAREAGASVLERRDLQNRGKGYALHYAFERLSEDVVAVIVVDADTLISPNLLWAFAARLEQGASAMQADYAVRNAQAGWRTRLMAIALGSFHIVRSRGRERLKLSCGLRGNGMGFRASLLKSVPHHAYSIVEDVEYGIRLAEAGHRVHYVDEAHVYGEMVSSAKAATSQRQRWEGGRAALARAYSTRLLRSAWLHRDAVSFDLVCDMLVPPLSRLVVMVSLGLSLAVGLGVLGWRLPISVSLWSFCVAAIAAYVVRGWSLSGTGVRGLLDLAAAPLYVAWKLTLRFSGSNRANREWVRTEREANGKRER